MISLTELYAAFLRDNPVPEPIETGLFEDMCRAAVTRMGVPGYCRMRRCRRCKYCVGPREPRDIPEQFCGEAPIVAQLPRCAARADDDWLAAFILEWQVVRLDYFGQPLPRPPEAVPPRQGLAVGDPVALDFVAAATDLSGSA